MKKFLRTLILFTTPLIILLFPPCFILIKSKENFFSIDKVLTEKSPYIIGYAYNEKNYKYIKSQTIELNDRVDVMALGSSRVLQFRDQMFTASFYNAGYTVSKISDFETLLRKIPKDKYPKYLIINLDQWMFNTNWIKSSENSDDSSYNFKTLPDYAVIKNIWMDIFSSRYGFASFSSDDSLTRIGLNAYVNNKGFRNDGSMYYGDQIGKLLRQDSTANDFKFADTFNRIEKGVKRFQFGSSIDPNAVKELNRFLSYCNKNKIFVVGFLPPFADDVYHKMVQTGKYEYLNNIYPAIADIFKRFEFEVYHFSTVSSCGSDDMEAIDGFHGGERTYQKILLKMLKQNSQLNNVCDSVQLKRDLHQSINNYLVYQ